MTDPADRHLEDRLHALARGVSVPVVPAEEDVRRGRRRLLRMRMAMAGATTGTLAVVLGLTSLTAGDPTATEVPPATQETAPLPATPDASSSVEPNDDETGGPDPAGGDTTLGGGVGTADKTVESAGTEGMTDTAPGRRPGRGVSGGAATHGAGGHTTGGQPWPPTQAATPTDPTPIAPVPGLPTGVPTESPTGTPTGTPTETPSGTPSETPTETPTETPSETPTEPPSEPPTDTPPVRVHKVLRYYNDVLAEHLDPERDHLQPYDRKTGTKESTKGDGKFYALGSTYRWEDGRTVTGLRLTVASGWDQVEWDCGASYSDWDCQAPDSETSLADGEVAVHDGVRQVAVEHADGQVVVLTAGLDSDEADLVAAAADGRLRLPGEAAVSPPRLDADGFAATGESMLVGDDETFDQKSFDRTPQVRGTWVVGDQVRGTLSWSARPRYGGGAWDCLTTYRTCKDVVLDELGTTVHVGQLKKAGGGWVVQYDGASYAVRVYSSDRTFPKKRAYEFVTMRDWQVVR